MKKKQVDKMLQELNSVNKTLASMTKKRRAKLANSARKQAGYPAK